MSIEYRKVVTLDAQTFIDLLERSGLAERRPVADIARIKRILENSDLLIVAHDLASQKPVGVARAITDFGYCCYLSDLAVDRDYQGRGIGKRLIEEVRGAAGPDCMCLLVSAPNAVSYYVSIGMPPANNAFMFPRET